MEQPTQYIEYCQCPLSGEVPTASNPDEVLLCERCHRETNPVRRATPTDMSDMVMTAIDQAQSNIDKDVYIVLRDHSHLRQRCIKAPSSIRSRLSKYSKTSDKVKDLGDKHQLDALYDSVRRLVGDGIFESEEKARERFPDLFSSNSIEGNKTTGFGAAGGERAVAIRASAGDDKVAEMGAETAASDSTFASSMGRVSLLTQGVQAQIRRL